MTPRFGQDCCEGVTAPPSFFHVPTITQPSRFARRSRYANKETSVHQEHLFLLSSAFETDLGYVITRQRKIYKVDVQRDVQTRILAFAEDMNKWPPSALSFHLRCCRTCANPLP